MNHCKQGINNNKTCFKTKLILKHVLKLLVPSFAWWSGIEAYKIKTKKIETVYLTIYRYQNEDLHTKLCKNKISVQMR